MLVRPVTVSVTALTRVLSSHDLGRPHSVIETEPLFLDDSENLAADEVANDELRAAGLLDRRNRLDPDLLDALTVLSRPSVEFYGWYNDHGSRDIGVAVVALGEEGLAVVRVGEKVRIASVRNQSLPATLIDHLPAVRAARMDAVNLRIGSLRANDGGADDVLLNARPHVAQDQRMVRLMMSEPAVGVGELYVAARDDRGARVVLAEPIRYRDTRQGRVLFTLSGGYLSVAPATPALLVERLRRARQDLVS